MGKIVILYSGGLDSFILYHYAKKYYLDREIECVYYKHGCQSEESELKNLPNFVEIKEIDWLNNSNKAKSKDSDPFAGNIYIPGRNLVFITLAACQKLPTEIWMGTLADENNQTGTDKNTWFRMETEKLLNYTLSPFLSKGLKIRFPFVENDWTKLKAIQWALDNELCEDEITKQVSCWNHDGENCGNCKQCFKRELNFRILGIKDSYKENPLENNFGHDLIRGYIEKYESGKANADEKNVYKMIKELQNANRL